MTTLIIYIQTVYYELRSCLLHREIKREAESLNISS